jgi:hypothetical protein
MKKLKRRLKETQLPALQQLHNLCDGICSDPLFKTPEEDDLEEGFNATDVLHQAIEDYRPVTVHIGDPHSKRETSDEAEPTSTQNGSREEWNTPHNDLLN